MLELMLSHVQPFATLWTVARQASLSMGFSRQEYCSGKLFPSPGDLPDPGIKSVSPALAGEFFTTRATWEARPRRAKALNEHTEDLLLPNIHLL